MNLYTPSFNKQNSFEINRLYILLLFLPPFWSCIITLYMLFKNPQKQTLFLFMLFYIICLTYTYPNYDTILRYWTIHLNKVDSIFEDDPLSNIARIFSDSIDAYYFFFLYWILTIYCFYKLITLHQNRISIYIIIISLFGLTWTNLMSLTYFTFSTTTSLYLYEKYKNKYILYIIVLFIAYFLHPGILLVLIPTMGLHILLFNNKYKLAILYLIAYYLITFTLFNGYSINTFDHPFLTSFTQGFNNYTSDDNIWGSLKKDFGIRGFIWDLEQYTFFFIILFFIKKHFKAIKEYTATSFYIISIITLINVINFYTFTERIRIVCTLSGFILCILLYRKKMLTKKMKILTMILAILQFISATTLFVQPRNDLFKNPYNSYDISTQIVYIPSFLLVIDIHDFGFNDQYLYKNSINMW